MTSYFGSLLGYHAYSWCITEKPTFQNPQFFFPLFVACFRLVFLVVLLQHLCSHEETLPVIVDGIQRTTTIHRLRLGCLGAAIPMRP